MKNNIPEAVAHLPIRETWVGHCPGCCMHCLDSDYHICPVWRAPSQGIKKTKESDHTPAAFSPPTTQGDTNPTQPSSGEQPTSVDKQINRYLGNHLYRFDYEDINHIKALISEERRQAKIEAVEKVSNRLDDLHQGTEGAGFVHYGEMGDWLDDYLTTLRGENNE